ncbi:MAG: hypothetical protein WCT19_00670 [Candidatus Paceibacterota bacterium]|jgi:Na+/melibiose symporter-like transporter
MKIICKKRKSGGFIGLLVLVISIGIMALLFTFFLKNELSVPPAETASGTDENAINAAEQTKNMIENRNQIETGAKN